MGLWRRHSIAAVLVGCITACSSTPRVKLVIDPAADTNDQLPCYLVVRAVDEKRFMADPYQSIADLVMSPDDSVLQSTVVFPGQSAELEIEVPEKGQLAAYVLFTYPDGDWKTLLPDPPPSKVKLSLRASRMSSQAP